MTETTGVPKFPPVRRRWFQFSLRSLLIAMFAAAIWPAHHANRFYRQGKAIEAIEKKGGAVQVQADGTIEYAFLPYVTADDVQRLRHLPSVRRLMLTSGMFDSSMTPLSRVAGLESITLADMKATGDGLKILAALPRLQFLTFRRVRFNEPDAPAALIGCKASEIIFEEMKINEERLKPLCAALPKCSVYISSGSGHVRHRFRLVRP
jgi:hypothetical protein